MFENEINLPLISRTSYATLLFAFNWKFTRVTSTAGLGANWKKLKFSELISSTATRSDRIKRTAGDQFWLPNQTNVPSPAISYTEVELSPSESQSAAIVN